MLSREWHVAGRLLFRHNTGNLARPARLLYPGTMAVSEVVERPSRLSLFAERILPIGILAVALVGAPVMIFSQEGLPRLRGLERELASVQEENKNLEREIDELRGHVDRLRDDPQAVEGIARRDLGMVRQSEIVFQFQKPKGR